MDTKLIHQKTKQIKSILELLKYSKLSSENYNSTQEPFFYKDKKNEFKLDHKNLPKIPESLNRHIKIIYELISNPNIEVYIGKWTIISLNNALERYNQYSKDGQKQIFDIGFQYHGMGWIKVLSCDLNNHLLFYRFDGGSNGWDRDNNYKKILNYDSNKYDHINFSQWKNQIMNSL